VIRKNVIRRALGKSLIGMTVLTVLSGCDLGDNAKKQSRHGSLFDDAAFETNRGFFIHIKADFEIVKTGELLKFDYVISCYNANVGGSFHRVLKPKIMFKATASGEARGQSLEHPRDTMTIPQVTWYPDVNDLSFAITYMSDDAYRNPNAHVKFKSYSAKMTDRAQFLEAKARLEADYKQIGAIPGPFGCADENVNSWTDEYSCGHNVNISRNNGRFIVFVDENHTDSHVRAYPVPDELIKAIRRLPDGKGRYYCGGGKTADGRKSIPHIASFTSPKKTEFNKAEKKILLNLYHKYRSSRHSQYLSYEAVEQSSGEVPSRLESAGVVYPFVRHGENFYIDLSEEPKIMKPESENLRYDTIQILHDEAWRGFGIEQSQDILVHMPEVAIDFQEPENVIGHAVFINKQPACVGNLSLVIYDLEQKLVFKIQR